MERPRIFALPALIVTAALVLSSCASSHAGKSATSAGDISGGDDGDFAELRTTDQMHAEIARLRIERDRLSETNALLQEELEWAHDDLRLVEKQFVTFEERLTSGYGKASAVAAAAEARMRFDATRAKYPSLPDSTQQDLTQLMDTSESLIRKGNYAAALFFADRANHTMIGFERREHLDRGSVSRSVAVALANLREGPGQYYPVVAQLTAGQTVVCMDEIGDWYHVKTPTGSVGWMHTSLLH
jgi:Bacterial SH3 domain